MNNKYVAASVAAVLTATSFVVGYSVAIKKFAVVYDDMAKEELRQIKEHYDVKLEIEVAKIKAHYNELMKEALTTDKELLPAETVKALREPVDYNSFSKKREATEEEQRVIAIIQAVDTMPSLTRLPETREPEPNPEAMAWLAKADTVEVSPITPKKMVPLKSDIIGEQRKDSPEVISWEDFQENEDEWAQQTLTYFAGDDTLIDQNDKQIENVELTVGRDNLGRFGELTEDKNIVLVKNKHYKVLYEVCLSLGSYAEEVEGESSS
jgi:hypothetical protein